MSTFSISGMYHHDPSYSNTLSLSRDYYAFLSYIQCLQAVYPFHRRLCQTMDHGQAYNGSKRDYTNKQPCILINLMLMYWDIFGTKMIWDWEFLINKCCAYWLIHVHSNNCDWQSICRQTFSSVTCRVLPRIYLRPSRWAWFVTTAIIVVTTSKR